MSGLFLLIKLFLWQLLFKLSCQLCHLQTAFNIQINLLSQGPTLRAKGHQDVKLLIVDGQRTSLPDWAETVLKDPDAAKFVSGVAVHWWVALNQGPYNLKLGSPLTI